MEFFAGISGWSLLSAGSVLIVMSSRFSFVRVTTFSSGFGLALSSCGSLFFATNQRSKKDSDGETGDDRWIHLLVFFKVELLSSIGTPRADSSSAWLPATLASAS